MILLRIPLSVWRNQHARQAMLVSVMLLALLPSLLFLGHWDEVFSGHAREDVPAAALFDLGAEKAEQAEHALHCHTNLASCSAQPLPAGVGLLAMHEALLGGQRLQFLGAATNDDRAPLTATIDPVTPPPRPA